jgi:hypothetical protein
MHTLLFERQQALRTKDFIRYAEELTLDVERFRDKLKNERYSERAVPIFLQAFKTTCTAPRGCF